MVGLSQRGLNGILADEMGLGKTLQVCACMCVMQHPVLLPLIDDALPQQCTCVALLLCSCYTIDHFCCPSSGMLLLPLLLLLQPL